MYVAWSYKAGAQTIADDIHLSFVCVEAEQCVLMNPNRPIADTIKGHKTCRGPIVPGCSEMSLDGTDTCLNCQVFYKVCVWRLHFPALRGRWCVLRNYWSNRYWRHDVHW